MGLWGDIKDTAGDVGDWLTGKYGVQKPGDWTPERGDYMLPGYGGMQERYGGMLGQDPRQAPQAGQSGFRGSQAQLADMLMGQTMGQGPGQEIARRQAEMQTDRGLAQQLAGARSARPGQSAMAARNAAMAAGQLQGAGAQAATMGGLQAQQQAVGQLGGVLGQARGQDLQRAMENARLQYQTMGLDDARQMELLRQSLMAAQAQQQGGQAYQAGLGVKWAQQSAQYAAAPSRLDKFLGAAQGGLNLATGMGWLGGSQQGQGRQAGGGSYEGYGTKPAGQSSYGDNLMRPGYY